MINRKNMKLKLYEARYKFPETSGRNYIDGRGLIASNLPETDILSNFMTRDAEIRDLTLHLIGSVNIDRRRASPRLGDFPGERIELYFK